MAFYTPLVDQWTLLNPTKKIAAGVCGLLLLALALSLFLLKPIWDKRGELQEDVVRGRERLAQIQKTLAQIKQFQRDLAQIDLQLKEVTAVLPESQEIPELLKSISSIGQQNALEFLLFKPEPELPRDFVTEVPVGVQLKGQYHQMGIFFDQIRRLPRLINVHNLEMGTYDEKSAKITARCQLVTYKLLSTPSTKPGQPPPSPLASGTKIAPPENKTK
jgi:type IV pilus assembly protein PilO